MTHNIKPTTKAPAKQSKKDQRQQARARRRQLTGLATSVVGLAVLALLGFGAWNLLRPKPGQSVALQARTHIQVSDSHEPYDTNPPTSGPHAGTVPANFYDVAPPDENLVHNLEHGYVIIWYDCATLDGTQCQNLKSEIKGVMDRAKSVVIASDIKKLIAVPRSQMDARIALTSWGRIDKLNAFNETEIMEFVNDFREQAPEAGAP